MSSYIFFNGPGFLGPRAISILTVMERGDEFTARELADRLGATYLPADRRQSAYSSVTACLRKLEEQGYVEADRAPRMIPSHSKGKHVRARQCDVLVWILTRDGQKEARQLVKAMAALKKTRLGLSLIQGTPS